MHITLEDVILVIESMPNNKSPGPDGFTAEFYKEFRDIVAADLMQILNDTLDRDLILENLNTSYIVLIPKK